jgi:hypothetical protein
MSNEPVIPFAALADEVEAHKAWIIDTANFQWPGVDITGQEVFDRIRAQVETRGWLTAHWVRCGGGLPNPKAALARAVQLEIRDRLLTSEDRSAAHSGRSDAIHRFASALDRLSAEEFSSDNPVVQICINDVRLLLTAVHGESNQFDIGLHINPFPEPITAVARCGLVLRTVQGVLHTGVVDAAGLALFGAAPPGIWHFQVVPPMLGAGRDGIPLPVVRHGSDAIRAAEDRYVVRTPAGITLIVSEPTPGAYELELTSPTSGPDLVGLRYQTSDGEPRRLYVPVSPSSVGPPSARVRLRGIEPSAPWEVEDTVGIIAPGMRDAQIIAQSIDAASDKGTRRAWRSLAQTAPDDVGRAIRAALTPGAHETIVSSPRVVHKSAEPTAAAATKSKTMRSPSHGAEPTPRRFLTADLPVRAPIGDVVSLLVRITTDNNRDHYRAHVSMKPFHVPIGGTNVVVVIEASAGLRPLDRLERRLTVPAEGDSEPIRFPFEVRTRGLLTARVTAWLGGGCVGELPLELSAEPDTPVVPGQPRRVGLDDSQPPNGEATLQVRRGSGGGYSFQLLSDSVYYEPVVSSEGGVLSEGIERTLARLEEFAGGSTTYSDAVARMSLRELGVGLWQELVPQVIREQFWELRDHISAFSIATDHDIIPWELLYPLAGRNDEGFLVEQFPVVRRVYGQQRTRRICMQDATFVLPQNAPPFAHEEITSINRILREARTLQRAEIISRLEPLKTWIDSGRAGLLHFASHNQFAWAEGGSSITMADGDFLPIMLNSSVAGTVLTRHPLIFINACRSAGAAYGYTQPMSWASQFMAAGAGAFIGTLWAIPSEVARRFSEAFYDAFVRQDMAFGTALTAARRAIRSDRDPSWLAYTAYSDPDARRLESSSVDREGATK